MIEPSEGRIVWFYPDIAEEECAPGTKHSAMICGVLDSRTVNLAVWNTSGAQYSRQAVQLLQDDDIAPAKGHYAAWMPFQKGQAAKTEAAQAAVPAAAPAPVVVDLQPVHDRIDTIEKGIDGKFAELGDWFKQTLGDLDQRIAAVTLPANPATPANGVAPAATEQPAAPAPDPTTAGQTAAAAAGTAPQPV